jgi:predicted permease
LRALVVAECAVALVILAGGGLLVNSFLRLTRVDTGIDPSNVLTAKVSVPVTPAWRGDPPRRRLHADLLERVAQLPEVRAAAIVSLLPLSEIRGGSPVGTPEEPGKLPRVAANVVSDDYFRAVGARILGGRVLAADDVATAPKVAVVNEVLAAALWPGQDPVGKTIVHRHYRGPVTMTVVGMVAPIRYDGLTSDYRPELFVSYRQTAVVPLQLVVRTAGDPMDTVAAIRAQLRLADPTGSVTLDGVSTLERRLSSAAARPRFFAVLLGAFGLAALLLSALGLHGVLSFWAEERRQEFGVRIALGATTRELYRQVVGQGATLAALGTIIGLGIAAATSRAVAGLLFGITALDASTYLVVSVLLLLAAIAACLPAARRAASVDAVQMLRGQ